MRGIWKVHPTDRRSDILEYDYDHYQKRWQTVPFPFTDSLPAVAGRLAVQYRDCKNRIRAREIDTMNVIQCWLALDFGDISVPFNFLRRVILGIILLMTVWWREIRWWLYFLVWKLNRGTRPGGPIQSPTLPPGSLVAYMACTYPWNYYYIPLHTMLGQIPTSWWTLDIHFIGTACTSLTVSSSFTRFNLPLIETSSLVIYFSTPRIHIN